MESVKYDIETGERLVRDIRPITITYRGYSKTFNMPGWYPDGNDDGTFTYDDMKIYDRALEELKTEAEHSLCVAEA